MRPTLGPRVRSLFRHGTEFFHSGDTLPIETLRLERYLAAGEAYHVARVGLGASGGRCHGHDFAELLWVEGGAGTHLVNGERVQVEAGDLLLIRPRDVHALRAGPHGEVTILNVAFEARTLDHLRGRYFPKGGWPWGDGDVPALYRLDAARLDRLGMLAGQLVAGPASRLLLERVLLELLHDVVAAPQRPVLPLWAETALQQLADDREALARGVEGLAALAGYSREHVNRVLRARTGRTATETVNEIRLARAARDLRMTDRPIAALASECGFTNLGYFYRLFKERFATTPRRYRLSHQNVVRGL